MILGHYLLIYLILSWVQETGDVLKGFFSRLFLISMKRMRKAQFYHVSTFHREYSSQTALFGSWKTLKNEHKKRQRGKALPFDLRALEDGNATIYSPNKIQQARAFFWHRGCISCRRWATPGSILYWIDQGRPRMCDLPQREMQCLQEYCKAWFSACQDLRIRWDFLRWRPWSEVILPDCVESW